MMKQLTLFKLPKKVQQMKAISSDLQKKSKKIEPRARKIYNNTYRAKLKGIDVKPHQKTIYSKTEDVDQVSQVRQVKNLMNLGFVIQITI
ncbi:hypothetical protein [Capnocytophaga canimorsus]|uniref:hypothetical protein n=1 Tax=Capnocytophaga canimorsus TaxID=28188 RepID=UPI000F4F99FD|nr:hypothetical protein [Capnocytophaga canimorsus]